MSDAAHNPWQTWRARLVDGDRERWVDVEVGELIPDTMYTALLEPLTPVAVRPGEDVSEVAARLQTVRTLEREIAALERKLRTEPQLNRKIELRRTLKTKQAELDSLR